jgi:hypothetical protein
MEVRVELDFEIDKITESIENTETGEALETLVLPVNEADLKGINKKAGWLFDWKFEFAQPERQVCKLVTKKEPEVIQGLVSFVKDNGFVLMVLIESAPFNRGQGKKYLGVCGNLTAFGCKISMEYGFDGVVAFDSKTALIHHYEKTLGAVHIGGQRMIIYEERAAFFIDKYFPNEERDCVV